ncbi:fasciclin domain-containing protein [Cyanobium sp. ATX 6E8]|nr:fasciclin domain-containing protein [Cyanobium sp. ATX 6E8]
MVLPTTVLMGLVLHLPQLLVRNGVYALPPGTVQTLVDNPPQLARILKYHVIAGAYTREALVAQPELPSLEGAPIPIRRADPFEVKNATVVTADIACDNGVVHVIDRVILPG